MVQGEVFGGFPVVLYEDGVVILLVLVVVHAAAAETELRGAKEKVLEVRGGGANGAAAGVGEEELAVEHLGKELVEVYVVEFTANAQDVRTVYPGKGVEESVVVLRLVLVGRWSRAELEAGAHEGEFVDAAGQVVGGAVDADVADGDGILVNAAIVDVVETEAEFVDQRGREEVRFRDAEKAATQREQVRKVEVGASGRGTKRGLQTACAEWQKGLGVGVEGARGEFVAAAVELFVPIGSELVIVVDAGLAGDEGYGAAGCRANGVSGRGIQIATGGAAELIALGLQQGQGYGIDGGNAAIGLNGSGGAAIGRGDVRDGGGDEGAGRIATLLAGALVVDEEEAEFFLDHGSAEAAAEDVLLHDGAAFACGVEEEVVGVELVVAEEFVGVAVHGAGATLQDGVDVAAAVAALAGVVERGLDLEFLDDVGVGQGRVGEFRDVVIGGRDSFDQIVVIVLALAVDFDAYVAAAKLCGRVEFALCAARQREQLLEILCGQRQSADGIGSDGLPCGGVGGLHGGDLRGDFHGFGDRAGLQRDGDARGFRDAHFDLRGLGFREAGFIHHYGVRAGGQQRDHEAAVRSRGHFAGNLVGLGVDDLYFGVGDGAAAGVLHYAADGARCATLREGPAAECRNKKKHHPCQK